MKVLAIAFHSRQLSGVYNIRTAESLMNCNLFSFTVRVVSSFLTRFLCALAVGLGEQNQNSAPHNIVSVRSAAQGLNVR